MLNTPIYTCRGVLLYIQVDHISGELLGSAIESLYNAGALNVQVLASVTKKNRPAHVVIVDVRPDDVDAVECVIVEELGSTGWHRFESEHRHVPVETITRDMRIPTKGGDITFTAMGKRIKNRPETTRPEHRNCVELQKILCDNDSPYISLQRVYRMVLHALQKDEMKEG